MPALQLRNNMIDRQTGHLSMRVKMHYDHMVRTHFFCHWFFSSLPYSFANFNYSVYIGSNDVCWNCCFYITQLLQQCLFDYV